MKLFHYRTDFLPWLNLNGKIVITIGVGSPFFQGGASTCQILLRVHLPGCLAYRLGWQAPVTGPQVARDQRKFGLREPKSSFLLSATGVQSLSPPSLPSFQIYGGSRSLNYSEVWWPVPVQVTLGHVTITSLRSRGKDCDVTFPPAGRIVTSHQSSLLREDTKYKNFYILNFILKLAELQRGFPTLRLAKY